jgi:hypothetical protein
MNAQNLQISVESAGQLELLVKDRDHQVGADRSPTTASITLTYKTLALRRNSPP